MPQELRLALFGPPGAGKGTQARLLRDRLNVTHISSGDLFRHHLGKGTPVGLRAKEYMNSGRLVPDEVTLEIMLGKILAIPEDKGFILDGFPRNPTQATELEKKLIVESRDLDKVVHIEVSESELLRRLEGRFVCRTCQTPHFISEAEEGQVCEQCQGELYQRDDDAVAAIQKRILVYNLETTPVLGFYRQRGLVVDISGDNTVDEVNKQVISALGS